MARMDRCGLKNWRLVKRKKKNTRPPRKTPQRLQVVVGNTQPFLFLRGLADCRAKDDLRPNLILQGNTSLYSRSYMLGPTHCWAVVGIDQLGIAHAIVALRHCLKHISAQRVSATLRSYGWPYRQRWSYGPDHRPERRA